MNFLVFNLKYLLGSEIETFFPKCIIHAQPNLKPILRENGLDDWNKFIAQIYRGSYDILLNILSNKSNKKPQNLQNLMVNFILRKNFFIYIPTKNFP